MKYFIDTNIFLRVLIESDKKIYDECLQLLSAIKENKIDAITSDIVMGEIVWTLKAFYKTEKKDIVDALRYISNLSGLTFHNNSDNLLSIDLFSKHNVKYADCLIASLNLINMGECTIVSYDKDFDQLKVNRLEPKDILSQL